MEDAEGWEEESDVEREGVIDGSRWRQAARSMGNRMPVPLLSDEKVRERNIETETDRHRRSYAIESAFTPIESPSKLDELELNSWQHGWTKLHSFGKVETRNAPRVVSPVSSSALEVFDFYSPACIFFILLSLCPPEDSESCSVCVHKSHLVANTSRCFSMRYPPWMCVPVSPRT